MEQSNFTLTRSPSVSLSASLSALSLWCESQESKQEKKRETRLIVNVDGQRVQTNRWDFFQAFSSLEE